MDSNKSALTKIGYILLTVIFYLSTVLPHEYIGGEINEVFEDLTRAQYNRIILIVLCVGVLLYSIVIIRSLLKHKERMTKGLLYLIITIIFCAICMRYLTVINIEAIHFLQYGLLSITVFQLVKRYDYTIWIILLMGFFDESYQHFYLTPNTFAHLDFNDMFLDLVGAGFGLSSLYCLNQSSEPKNSKIGNGILVAYAILIVTGIILYVTGMMRIWPTVSEELAPIQIMQKELSGFWQTYRKVHQYHIMRPLEGVLILIATAIFYTRLDE